MTNLDYTLFIVRVIMNFLIAALLGEAARGLFPALWRRKLDALPAALVVLCICVSVYAFVAAVLIMQNVNLIALPFDLTTLRHIVTLPLAIELLASCVVFYQVRLRPSNGSPRLSLLGLAQLKLDNQKEPIATSQELTEEISNKIQALFFKAAVSQREREEAEAKLDELRRMLSISESIRFELQRALIEERE